MAWFVANQQALVYSAFVLCSWFIVQMLKQCLRPLLKKITNVRVQSDLKIVVFISLNCGVGFALAAAYKHLYADANLIYIGASLSMLATVSHETIYKFLRNIVLLIFEKYQARKELKFTEIKQVAQDTFKDAEDIPADEKSANKTTKQLMDELKKL